MVPEKIDPVAVICFIVIIVGWGIIIFDYWYKEIYKKNGGN